MAILEQLGANARLCAATEMHPMRSDDRHDAILREEVKAAEHEGEIGSCLGCKPVVFEQYIVCQRVSRRRKVAERWVGDIPHLRVPRRA